MSRVITLDRSRPQRGWFHQRHKVPLSLAASDGIFVRRSRKRSEFQAAELARSTGFNCNTTTFNGHLPFHSLLCQAFNTHRATIVERFSPTRF
jgi:hypothetical protein